MTDIVDTPHTTAAMEESEFIDEVPQGETIDKARPDSRNRVPELGYRNYWQPLIASRSLRHKPVGLKLMGDEVVAFRTPDGPRVLGDFCPHRGARLSMGRCDFKGTISCPYHGWVFDGEGQCVAALTDGPESRVPDRATAQSYPAKDLLGVVWVYLGVGEPPELEADLPRSLTVGLSKKHTVQVFRFKQDWKANWRVTMDNAIDGGHAIYLHRPSLWFLFFKIPAYVKLKTTPTEFEDPERFISYQITEAAYHAEFPGIGQYPRHRWWRRFNMKLGGQNAIGLPGVFIFRAPNWTHIRWAVPVDEVTTRNFMFAVKEGNALKRALFTLNFWFWLRWIFYYNFSAQDKRLLENTRYENLSRELLTKTDQPVLAWRRLSERAR